jgi:hypothetical protein
LTNKLKARKIIQSSFKLINLLKFYSLFKEIIAIHTLAVIKKTNFLNSRAFKKKEAKK